MDGLIRRYHVPRSQVWEGSRGRQSGRVHLHVPAGGRFDHGRIHRAGGDALCGRASWYERAPLGNHELSDDALCPRCVEIASRAGASPADISPLGGTP